MPLSEQTLKELRAGAEQLAKVVEHEGVTPEYIDALIRTQERAKLLRTLENEGKIKIERMTRLARNGKKSMDLEHEIVVCVGPHRFVDEVSNVVGGGWPSETFVAQIVLALAAGEGDKEEHELKIVTVKP